MSDDSIRDLGSTLVAAGVAVVTGDTEPSIALTQKGPLVVSLAAGGAPDSGELVFTLPGSFGTDSVLIAIGVSGSNTAVVRPGTKTATTIPFTVHDAADDSALDLTAVDVTLDFLILGLV
jgi:hypothetical protein